MYRIARMFSLSTDVVQALELKAKERGEPMSRLVELGIRHVLAMPPPESPAPRGLAPTRAEEAVAWALRQAGPGWHAGAHLAQRSGLTLRVAERALRGLERRGEAVCWGLAPLGHDGLTKAGHAWGTRQPLEVVAAVIARWDGRIETVGTMTDLVGKLAKGIAPELHPEIRRRLSDAVGIEPEAFEL